MKKFYRQTFEITVLSETLIPENMEFEEIFYEMNEGDFVGTIQRGKVDVLDGKQTADALVEAGSFPGFFYLNDDGTLANEGE